MTLNDGEIVKLVESLESESKELKKILFQISWYMRGSISIEQAFQLAGNLGYRAIYLETMPELKKAIYIYEKMGFQYLKGPMGNSGHTGCDIWMIKTL